jgi:hypothetical protein
MILLFSKGARRALAIDEGYLLNIIAPAAPYGEPHPAR